MEMPEVQMCDATECYFNQDKKCHATAISVGSPCPRCDAYTKSSDHGTPSAVGRVGACHEKECKFNEELSCQAPNIHVGHHMMHADCQTYSPR